MNIDTKRFGDLAIQHGFITPDQLIDALKVQAEGHLVSAHVRSEPLFAFRTHLPCNVRTIIGLQCIKCIQSIGVRLPYAGEEASW
jgi:hypothetical protein